MAGVEPIPCELHDHLELACLLRYRLRVLSRDGSAIVGHAADTRATGGIEYLVLATEAGRVDLPMHQIAHLSVLTADARFSELSFPPGR